MSDPNPDKVLSQLTQKPPLAKPIYHIRSPSGLVRTMTIPDKTPGTIALEQQIPYGPPSPTPELPEYGPKPLPTMGRKGSL